MNTKTARKQFAGRNMVSPAMDVDGKTRPRKNVRRPAGVSFRRWVRETFLSSHALSPKLQEIFASR